MGTSKQRTESSHVSEETDQNTANERLDLSQFEGHTPGPWDYEIPETGDNIVVDSEGAFVAQVSCREDSNTRLIAAAPDLLDEIERLQLILHDHLICLECGWRKCYGDCNQETED